MSNTYIWKTKHLNTDKRGYASDGYFELEGTDNKGEKYISSVAVSFGGADLKPISDWQQTDIDTYAETLYEMLEQNIQEQQAIITQLQADVAALKG